MNEKKYEVLDESGNAVARDMNLPTALLFIKAWIEEYYMEPITLTINEMVKIPLSNFGE